MRSVAGIALCSLLSASPAVAAPAQAVAPAGAESGRPAARAYSWLAGLAGAETAQLMADKGYLVVHRFGNATEIVHVQWELLEPLSDRARRLLAAQAAILSARRERGAHGEEDALRAALEIPAAGLLTPRVQAAASLLLGFLDERRAAGTGLLPEVPLASQPWARQFVQRHDADLSGGQDGAALVGPFFEELLSGLSRSEEAERHVLSHAAARYGSDIRLLLQDDVRAGRLSDGLRGWLEKYLVDNQRAQRLSRWPKDYEAVFDGGKLERELAELRQAVEGLSADPNAAQTLRRILGPEPAAKDSVRVAGGDLHAHPGPGARSPEPGDRLELSAAYWVEGLGKGLSVRVQETAFVDLGPRGIVLLGGGQRSRSSGGPHSLALKADMGDWGPLVVRLILQAEGSEPTRRALVIDPGGALDGALTELARADATLVSCKLREAVAAYESVASKLETHAGRPQFDALAAELKHRRERVKAALVEYEALDGMLEGLERDASTEACEFSTEGAIRARASLARLPAGCSRDLAPKVNRLYEAAAQRRRDQQAFLGSVESARRLEASCEFPKAIELYSAALGVLDADPAALCRRAEVEYKNVKDRDLPAALAVEPERDELRGRVDAGAQALTGGDPAAALVILNPTLSKISALKHAACFEAQRRTGEDLGLLAAAGLRSPADALAAVRDPVAETHASVARELARVRSGEEARKERELAQQAPVPVLALPQDGGTWKELEPPPLAPGVGVSSPAIVAPGGAPRPAPPRAAPVERAKPAGKPSKPRRAKGRRAR